MLDPLIKGLPYMLTGAVQTAILAGITIVGGLIFGVIIGIAALSAIAVMRWLCTLYIFVLRGIPILVLMFLAYFGLPAFGVRVSDYAGVAGALVLYAAAFVAEITRSAILSVPRGQVEGAKAIGFTWLQTLRLVILPQAVRLSMAPLLNHSVMMVKSTAYVSIVGVWELSYAAREVAERSLAPFQVLFGAMIIYFIVCYPMSFMSRRLEQRYAYST